MSEIAELATDLRLRNKSWMEDIVIPNLYRKSFPLKRVVRTLYRAGTTGISQADYAQRVNSLIHEERREVIQEQGVAIVLPVRGDFRQLRIVAGSRDPEELDQAVLDEIKSSQLNVSRPKRDGFYLPPVRMLDRLADELIQSTEVQYANASTVDQAEPKISEFILLFDALHPFFDGNGRAMRATANYLAYKYGYYYDFPLCGGHMDQDSEIVRIMQGFRDVVQVEEGFPILTDAVLRGEKGKFYINFVNQSIEFLRIINERRENLKLRPYYRVMDQSLVKLRKQRSE
jgi:hypothetical protein